jgi:hypothetical protein
MLAVHFRRTETQSTAAINARLKRKIATIKRICGWILKYNLMVVWLLTRIFYLRLLLPGAKSTVAG